MAWKNVKLHALRGFEDWQKKGKVIPLEAYWPLGFW
jgi:hypothetical protein